jgi:hypothetical protein
MRIRRAEISDAEALRDAEASTAETPGLLASRPDELEVGAFEKTIRELDGLGPYLVAELEDPDPSHRSINQRRLDCGDVNFVGYQYTLPFMRGVNEKPEDQIERDLTRLAPVVNA